MERGGSDLPRADVHGAGRRAARVGIHLQQVSGENPAVVVTARPSGRRPARGSNAVTPKSKAERRFICPVLLCNNFHILDIENQHCVLWNAFELLATVA